MSESDSYKDFIKNILGKDPNSFCEFRREQQLDIILPKIQELVDAGNMNALDLCCGYGRLIFFLIESFPSLNITGLDYTEELIEQARSKFSNKKNIKFFVENAYDLKYYYDHKFDFTIIHKTISWLPYYDQILKEAFKVTKNRILITSLFCDGDIDYLTKINLNASKNANGSFVNLNTYSLPKFSSFCRELGAKDVKSTDMRMTIDLNKSEDANKLQTFTVRNIDNEIIEFTGVVQLNWKLIEIIL